MKYLNIKKAKLSHEDIRKAFKYKSLESFRASGKGRSAHKDVMEGLDELLGKAFENLDI